MPQTKAPIAGGPRHDHHAGIPSGGAGSARRHAGREAVFNEYAGASDSGGGVTAGDPGPAAPRGQRRHRGLDDHARPATECWAGYPSGQRPRPPKGLPGGMNSGGRQARPAMQDGNSVSRGRHRPATLGCRIPASPPRGFRGPRVSGAVAPPLPDLRRRENRDALVLVESV